MRHGPQGPVLLEGAVRQVERAFQQVPRAAREAIAAHARDGLEGVRRRQGYALAKHLLAPRIQKMVRTVAAVAAGQLRINLRTDPDHGVGLDLRS